MGPAKCRLRRPVFIFTGYIAHVFVNMLKEKQSKPFAAEDEIKIAYIYSATIFVVVEGKLMRNAVDGN